MKIVRKDKGNNEAFDYSELGFILILCAPLSLFFGWLIVKVFKLGDNGEPTGDFFTNLGVYGDFLGGSTLPFLTLVTIAYVYKTFKLQEEQLKTQKEEMRMTRETLEEQNKTARMQRFENSFFKHLEEIRIDKEINLGDELINVSMGGALFTIIEKYKEEMRNRLDGSGNYSIPIPSDYEKFFGDYSSVADASLGKTTFYDKRIFSFVLKINRVFEIIYQYRGSMEEWEIEFYLGYLMDEIDFSSWSLVILESCIMTYRTHIIRELKLDNWIHQSGSGLSALDIHFISYIVHGDPYFRYEE